ncbi:MAG: DUF4835 family protein [Balneolaceae bacterium]
MKNILRKIKKVLWLPAVILLCPAGVYAQEFQCDVNINDRQITGSSFEYVRELQPEIENYINRNRWSDDRFEEHERINCRIQIVLTSVDEQFNYTAEVLINIIRPIYNTNQESSAVALADNNWQFSYPRNKNLIRDDLQFDNLTSFLDFYAYIMLGYDYDTFAELGGSAFFAKAQDVFEIAQNSSAAGWGRSIGAQRNRFGLVNDLMNPAYNDLRRASYLYHRHGLDQFTLDAEASIAEVMEAMRLIRDNKRVVSNNYLFDIFFDSKHPEIVALLQAADLETRIEASNLLRDVDPSHTGFYERLMD